MFKTSPGLNAAPRLPGFLAERATKPAWRLPEAFPKGQLSTSDLDPTTINSKVGASSPANQRRLSTTILPHAIASSPTNPPTKMSNPTPRVSLYNLNGPSP